MSNPTGPKKENIWNQLKNFLGFRRKNKAATVDNIHDTGITKTVDFNTPPSVDMSIVQQFNEGHVNLPKAIEEAQKLAKLKRNKSKELLQGPLNKNAATKDYEDLVGFMLSNKEFIPKIENGALNITIKINGVEKNYNVSAMIEEVNFTHLTLKENDFNQYLKILVQDPPPIFCPHRLPQPEDNDLDMWGNKQQVSRAVSGEDNVGILDKSFLQRDATLKNMEPAERLALNIYTGEAYHEINSFLRGEILDNSKLQNPQYIKELMSITAMANSGLRKIPEKEISTQTLYRRDGKVPDEIFKQYMDAAENGGTIFTSGFMSTSEKKPAFSPTTTEICFVFTDARGRRISGLSANPQELEVLLSPTQLKFNSYTVEKGVYFFNVTPVVELNKTPKQEEADAANRQLEKMALGFEKGNDYKGLTIQFNNKNETIGIMPNGDRYNLSDITKKANLYRFNVEIESAQYKQCEKVLNDLNKIVIKEEKKQIQTYANDQYLALIREILSGNSLQLIYVSPDESNKEAYIFRATRADGSWGGDYNLNEIMKEVNLAKLPLNDQDFNNYINLIRNESINDPLTFHPASPPLPGQNNGLLVLGPDIDKLDELLVKNNGEARGGNNLHQAERLALNIFTTQRTLPTEVNNFVKGVMPDYTPDGSPDYDVRYENKLKELICLVGIINPALDKLPSMKLPEGVNQPKGEIKNISVVSAHPAHVGLLVIEGNKIAHNPPVPGASQILKSEVKSAEKIDSSSSKVKIKPLVPPVRNPSRTKVPPLDLSAIMVCRISDMLTSDAQTKAVVDKLDNDVLVNPMPTKPVTVVSKVTSEPTAIKNIFSTSKDPAQQKQRQVDYANKMMLAGMGIHSKPNNVKHEAITEKPKDPETHVHLHKK